MSADLYSKLAADRQFDPGYLEPTVDECSRCNCNRLEGHPGAFKNCNRCGEPFCGECGYDDWPDVCAPCQDRMIERMAVGF